MRWVAGMLVVLGLGMAAPEAARAECNGSSRTGDALVQLWRGEQCGGGSVKADGWRPNFHAFADTATGQTVDVANDIGSFAVRPGFCVRFWNNVSFGGDPSTIVCSPNEAHRMNEIGFVDRAGSMKVCASDRQAECNANGPASTIGQPPPTQNPDPNPNPDPTPGPEPTPGQPNQPGSGLPDDPLGDPDPTDAQPGPVARSGCTVPTVKIGALTASATCFARDTEGGGYVATGTVRVGGVDIVAPAGVEVRVRPKKLEVSTSGAVDLKVGRFVLYRRAFTWNLGGTFTFTAAPGIKLRGLPVTGTASFTLDGTAVDVNLTVGLPSVLGGVTGSTSIRVGANGVVVKDVEVGAGSARLGRFELRNLVLRYSKLGKGVYHFNGAATLVLPSPYAPTISGNLGFGVGDDYFVAGGEVDGLNKPISSGVFLQRIRFEIGIDPFTLSGGLGISAGPQVLGHEALSLDGDFTYKAGSPDSYSISGSGRIADIEVGSGSISYKTDGRLDLSAEVKLSGPKVSFSGEISGWVDGSRAFNIQGDGEAKVGPFTQGAEAVVSSKGMAACRTGAGPNVGFGFDWDDKDHPHIFGGSCGLSDWEVERPKARAAQAGAERFATFGIAAGTSTAAFSAVGAPGSGPPIVRLEDPSGKVVTSTPLDPNVAESTPQVVHFQDVATNTTYLAVAGPAAGTYKLVVQNGSPPAAELRAATSLPAPNVRARVRGRGRSRLLSFSLTAAKGQTVTFYEQGPDTRRNLGTRSASGRLRFSVPDGRAGRRQIIAIVSQNGLPLQTGAVASYVAPPPRRPARPGGVRVTSRGGKYLVRWRGARRAASYEVRIYVGDGRRLLYLPERRARRVDVPGARKGLRVNVTVRGLTATGLRGPRGRDSYRPR